MLVFIKLDSLKYILILLSKWFRDSLRIGYDCVIHIIDFFWFLNVEWNTARKVLRLLGEILLIGVILRRVLIWFCRLLWWLLDNFISDFRFEMLLRKIKELDS